MPAGTGGTYVEETFKLSECLINCFKQVAFIFGINTEPDYLYGIDFASITSQKIKFLNFVSIALIIIIILIYIIFRIKSFKKDRKIATDLIFLSFIAMCIGSSSVTIRVEMRFIYVSFVAAIIYLSYMIRYLSSNININIVKILAYLSLIIVFITRVPLELEYRESYPKIHCIVDLNRVNSIYDNTIGRYGLDDILNGRKIYIINKYYDMTEFYAEYILKIYDKNDIGNKMILVKDITEIPVEDLQNDSIVLYEDYTKNIYAVLSDFNTNMD